MPRPLLFLDVDGTLIPFGGVTYPSYHTDSLNPLLARLDPAHGTRLCALSCELIWATTWLSDAWVDDEIGATDRAWVSAHHAGDTLLHKVDPRVGITADDYATLAEWRTRLAD